MGKVRNTRYVNRYVRGLGRGFSLNLSLYLGYCFYTRFFRTNFCDPHFSNFCTKITPRFNTLCCQYLCNFYTLNLQNPIEKDRVLLYNVENDILSSYELIDWRRDEDTTDTFAETFGYALYVLQYKLRKLEEQRPLR